LAISIRRLQEDDLADPFDCGDESLNNYLKKHAWNNQQKSSIGVTYVATDESAPRIVIGYFTLAMTSAPRDSLPKKFVRGLPPYELPMILIARLAVDRRFTSHGMGKALLVEALKICSFTSDHVGCRYIVVDAYESAVPWYQHFGFIAIEEIKGAPTRMYLDIRTLKTAAQSK
jgi:predicted GNAT family N-acyltransferase